MGVGISVVSKKPPRRLFGLFRSEPRWADAFYASALAVASAEGFEFIVPPRQPGNLAQVSIHFGEEPVDCSVADDAIVLSARTSTCGPGYHAFLCRILDHMNSKWKTDFSENEEFFDETGYFRTRDFSALQRSHACWLKSVAELVSNSAQDGNSLRVSLSLDCKIPANSQGQVFTPSGPKEAVYFSDLQQATDKELALFAENWFPWWNEHPQARDYIAMGQQILWTDVPWHVPVDAYERQLMVMSAKCFEAAIRLDGGSAIPKREFDELKYFIGPSAEVDRRPHETGIGYLRRNCIWALGFGWNIELPGYWYETENEENHQLYFGNRYIYHSSFIVSLKAGASAKFPINLGPTQPNEILVEEFVLRGLSFRLVRQKEPTPDLPVHLNLTVASNDGLLVLTFTSDDETWLDEIPGIVRTVTYASELDRA